MSIKSLFFFLFLYVCLVWVGAALLKEGPEIRQFGLLWTAVGLIALIAWIVFSWVWGWFRVAKARSAAKPKAAPKAAAPAVAMHEEDAALLALVQEAKVALTRATSGVPAQARFSDLPVFLLVGPEQAGKTSTFINSTLEPACLSGQPGGAGGQTIPTRLGNIWLAKNTLFIELSGRAFSGDLARWASLLRTLRGGETLPWWKTLWKQTDAGLNLRGILAFGDVKEFMGASSPQGRERLERLSGLWRDRLGAITEVFGRQYPVYWISTKTDSVPYFGDYFGRLRGPELSQVFGCTLPLQGNQSAAAEAGNAQAENKRLTRATSPLLHRLAERRVIHLAREEDAKKKPGIYEFPRELRRIRPTVVQFLVDTFRPHPLRHTPFLRGFYFTATCDEEMGAASAPVRTRAADDSIVSDASAIFNADATQVFKGAGDGASMVRPAVRGPVLRRWAFIPELLNGIVLRDNAVPAAISAPVDQRLDLYRKAVCGGVCFVSLLLCLCLIRSWVGNSRLLDAVNKVADGRATQTPTLGDLTDLDKLRGQVLQLLEYDRNGAPWRLRWGLYTGNALVDPARRIYFRRFDTMLLHGLNDSLVSKLRAAPNVAAPEDPNYRLISDELKTHLMISSSACKPDSSFASRVLRQTLDETNPGSGYDWRILADRQIDFYAAELPEGNPAKAATDQDAVAHARQYLQSMQGADRFYAALLSAAEKRFGNTQTLRLLAPDYGKVLTGAPEVSGVFTPEGWAFIRDKSRDVKAAIPGDACLGETTGKIAGYQQDSALADKIQRLYVKDYVAHWQKFVNGFAVLRYGSAGDAARKLTLLADHKSPLLAVFALTTKNTYFPPAPQTFIDKGVAPITTAFDAAKQKLEGLTKDHPLPDAKQVDSTGEISAAFQPVQLVVPGNSETWVTEKNNPYIDALAQLASSMDAIAHSTTEDPALIQAASQNYEKATAAARQLTVKLSQNSNNVDDAVERLLNEPITQAKAFIPTASDPKQKANKAGANFCASVASTFHKFPFRPGGEDARLDEFVKLFAPGSGSVWKFQADALANFVVKDGAHWKAKDGAPAAISGGMLNFLNRAQDVTDAFFPNGATQPQLRYTLRPKLDPAYQNVFIEFDVDGQTYQWKNSLQKQFVWPASPGGTGGGAVGKVVTTEGLSLSFSSYAGVWAIFHMMGEAEPRLLGNKIVEWKYLRGRAGIPSPITPAPVRLEFVEFPGGADVFNPKFFEGLQCGGASVQ